MAKSKSRGHDPSRGLVDRREQELIAEAVAVGRGGAADPAEVDAVIEWVARVRLNFTMAEAVINGALTVRMQDGTPTFRKRTRPDTPVS